MTNDLINKNKLIAEFMGAKLSDHWKDKPTYTYQIKPTEHSCYNWCADEMQYHTSYDWLMDVWFKFRDLKIETMKLKIKHASFCQAICYEICYSPPIRAFNKIVKAIEWYNSQKQS